MDGVLADFDKAIGNFGDKWKYIENPPEMFIRGFFRSLEIVPGAKEAVRQLLCMPSLDVYVLTKPTTKNLWCATEKYQWINEHFPELLRKMFLACDKSFLKGDYLIDDDDKWEEGFEGTFLHFNRRKAEYNWCEMVKLLGSLEKGII